MQKCIEQHKQRKKSVIDFLSKSIQCLQKMNNVEKDIKRIEEFKQIVENDLFSIVVVGEFSSGKSTFLNALMHKKILPSFTKETTATVNFLRHIEVAKNGEKGKVYYNDGKTKILQTLNEEDIKRFVSTQSNEDVAKKIKKVDFYLDSEFLQNGVMLVDSPGLNGIEEGHREITENQIKESHAVIFVFNAQQPGSNTNFESLSDIKKYSNNIFFLLNKIDCIKESEGETPETVIITLKNSYKKKFPNDKIPEIWPVSAELALEARDSEWYKKINKQLDTPEDCLKLSLIEKFETRLWKYLTCGEKSREQLMRPIEVSLKLLEEKQKSLEYDKNMLEDDDGEKKVIEKREFLEREIQELNEKKNSTELDVDIENKIAETKELVGAECKKVRERIRMEMQDFDDREELIEHCHKIEHDIQRQMRKIIKTTDETIKKKINTLMQQNVKGYYTSLQKKFESVTVTVDENNFGGLFEVPLGINTREVEKVENSLLLLSQEIENLKKDKKVYQENMYDSVKRETYIRDKVAELHDLKQEIQELKNMELNLPQIRTHEIEVEEQRSRDGLFGKINELLNGKKRFKIKKRVINEEDKRNCEDKINYIKLEKDKLNNKKEETEEEIRGKRQDNYMSSNYYKNRIDEVEDEIQEKRLEKQKMEKELHDLIKQADEKAQKRIHRAIKNYLDDKFDSIENGLKDSLNANREEYMRCLQETVNANIINDLENKKQELAELVKQMELKGEKRAQQIEKINVQLNDVKGVIENGKNIQKKLEILLNDSIGNEEFTID